MIKEEIKPFNAFDLRGVKIHDLDGLLENILDERAFVICRSGSRSQTERYLIDFKSAGSTRFRG